MSDEPVVEQGANASGHEAMANDAEMQYWVERLRSEQNLQLGIAGGAVAALVGAIIWAVITYVTKYQIGFMAIGVGFLVGYAVRTFGKGIDKIYGVMGAALSLLGCVVGNFLAICAMYAHEVNVSFFAVLGGIDPEGVGILMTAGFSAMDILFYGIAIYQGYRFSFRPLTDIVSLRLGERRPDIVGDPS